MTDTLIPCRECGAEVFDAEETTAPIEEDFEFGGETATREVPARVCAGCGAVTPL